jgi:hypothetical protein
MNSFINMVGFILLVGLGASYFFGGIDELDVCRYKDTLAGHGDNYARLDCGYQLIKVDLGVQ